MSSIADLDRPSPIRWWDEGGCAELIGGRLKSTDVDRCAGFFGDVTASWMFFDYDLDQERILIDELIDQLRQPFCKIEPSCPSLAYYIDVVRMCARTSHGPGGISLPDDRTAFAEAIHRQAHHPIIAGIVTGWLLDSLSEKPEHMYAFRKWTHSDFILNAYAASVRKSAA